jgi:hypothetical protein
MSSFMRAAGHRLTSLVRTSTSSPCGSTAVSCRPDELNGVGIEIDPRCGQKLDGSPTPGGPNHRFTWRRPAAQGIGACRQRSLAAARRTFVGGWKVYDY